MIVSDRFQFVFFHNPKVAGASVHSALARYHDIEVGLWGVEPDGTVRAHFGIDDFARRYPEIWARIQGYRLICLCRDPHERFLSSFGQYSKMYGETDIRFAPRARVRGFLFETIAALEALGGAEQVLGIPKFTAFRPQWIFHRSDDHAVRARAFPLAEIEDMFRFVEALTGAPVKRVRINEKERLALPGPLAWALSSGKVSRGIGQLPGAAPAKAWFRRRFARGGGDEDDALALTDADQATVQGFVERFYARDFRELADLRAQAAPPGAPS